MAVVEELIRKEENGSISFGNYELEVKTKQDGFIYNGDSYKIKTFYEITKLEKNGMFVYESVPGTAVHDFVATDKKVTFSVEGESDAQITLELEPEKDYKVYVNDSLVGEMKTNLGGKLSIAAELADSDDAVNVVIDKVD